MRDNALNGFKKLQQRNTQYVLEYKNSPLMQLIHSNHMKIPAMRQKLLACIQTFSNYFQRIVMLRAVYAEEPQFSQIAQQHLQEEFGHHLMLMQDRKNQPPTFDPVLDSGSAWFAWKMQSLDSLGKLFLVHFVLEASANVFFQSAHQVMKQYGETNYFKIHEEYDAHHETMGANLLQDLRDAEYQHLFELQQQGWAVLNMVCDQMAAIVMHEREQGQSIAAVM